MGAKEKILTVQVSAIESGTQLSVTGINAYLDVNSVARADLVCAPIAQAPVESAMGAKLFARMQKRQQRRLSGQDGATLTASIIVSDGSSLLVDGYINSPSASHVAGDSSESVSVIGKDAIIDALDLSVYKAGFVTLRDNTAGLEAMAKIAGSGDVTALISSIVDALLGSYDVSLAACESPAAKATVTSRHNINVGAPIAQLRQLLATSCVSDSVAKILRKSEIRQMAVLSIISRLQQPGASFLQILMGVASALQTVYIPSLSGAGKFIPIGEITDGASSGKVYDVQDIRVIDGSARLAQPGSVVVEAPGVPDMRNSPDTTARIVMCYPDPPKSGYVHTLPLPFWCGNGSLLASASADPPPAAARKSYTDLQGHRRKVASAASAAMSDNEALADGLRDLCRRAYDDILLADSRVEIGRMPLDLSAKVGERASVSSKDSSYTGFVASVKHRLVLTNGTQMDSNSSVSLTHVKL